MNYEEKYNKVIEKIQHLLEDAKDNRHIIVRVEDIEKAFPEVKETEDERIRRNIRELLLDSPASELVGHNIDLEQALNWLERQGGNLVKNGYTDNKDLIKYADNYSHEIWHKLMDNFKNIKDYHIGCNDVSDIVFNAIIDTCNWLEKQGMSYTKRDVDNAYLKGVTSTKNEIEKQYEANYQIRKDIATFIFNYKGDIKDRAKWMNYLGIKVSFAEKQSKQKSDFFCGEHCKGFQDTGKCFADGDCKAKREAESIDKVESKFHKGDWIATSYGKVNQVITVDKDGDGYTLDDGVYFTGSWCDMYHLWDITKDAKDGDVLVCDDKVFLYNGKLDLRGRVCAYCGIYKTYYELRFTKCAIGNCFTYKEPYPATKEQRDLLFQKMKEAGYEWDAEKKELKKISQRMISAEVKEAMYDKPWSEEDETYLDHIITAVKLYYTDDKGKENPWRNELLEWLKSLKGRVQQPKQEWSKEDENHIQHISDFILRNRVGDTDAIYRLEQDVNWLKSLRPQNRWKPSDEQMNLLEELMEDNNQRCFYTILKSLYQDLKKLKE